MRVRAYEKNHATAVISAQLPRRLSLRWLRLAVACLPLGGCGQTSIGAALSDAGRNNTTTDDAGVVDAGAIRAEGLRPPVAVGLIEVDACIGQTGIAERCTLVTNASACTRAKCSKLVVVFSGGEMGCVSGAGYNKVMDGYASHGYAAVCINPFESSEGSGARPYIDEAARIDLAVREATTGAWARAFWTGEELLFEGISHGATAPVIAMARTKLDEQPHWHGSRATAGCFFDGAYDQAATADLLATGGVGGRACTVPVSHARWLQRYCGPGASATSCSLVTHPKAQEDTLTNTDVLPEHFAIRNFKMVECGSAMPACVGDIVAGPPIQLLCQRLDAAPGHTCSFAGLPNDGHLTCHANHYDVCRTWFEASLTR